MKLTIKKNAVLVQKKKKIGEGERLIFVFLYCIATEDFNCRLLLSFGHASRRKRCDAEAVAACYIRVVAQEGEDEMLRSFAVGSLNKKKKKKKTRERKSRQWREGGSRFANLAYRASWWQSFGRCCGARQGLKSRR